MGFSLAVAGRGRSRAAVCGLLAAVASHCRACVGSRHKGFDSCGAKAQELWHLVATVACGILGPGIEPVSPALQGGFLTTGPPGKPQDVYF